MSPKRRPVPLGRSAPCPRLINRPDRSTPIRPNHTVPYGTVPFLHGYQAINCLDFGELSRVATFVTSLRDKALQRLRRRLSPLLSLSRVGCCYSSIRWQLRRPCRQHIDLSRCFLEIRQSSNILGPRFNVAPLGVKDIQLAEATRRISLCNLIDRTLCSR